MKKAISCLLCIVFLICTLSLNVFADPGDVNIDGGGGGMGSGTSANFWSSGNDGVRITVVEVETGRQVSSPVDFSNRVQPATIIHFGKVNKVQYCSGIALSPSSASYHCFIPDSSMPTIVSSSASNNIEAVKRYFCSEYACMMVAEATGISYTRLISGSYKLLIEPIAYFTYNSTKYCMTATEAALYDQLAEGALRSKMTSLTHQNLPLAMFLEYDDLGFRAWNGSTSSRQNNTDIINYLGMGIVRFTEPPTGSLVTPDVEYRVDTDVITSVTLYSSANLTPDNPASVTFTIDGRSYTVNSIMIPRNSSQLVWVKWHTPSTAQDLTIYVTVSGAYSMQSTLVARIVNLNERIPPDPRATDTKPGYSVLSIPYNAQKTSANWSIWQCYWVANWIWHPDIDDAGNDVGEWVDHGNWEYSLDTYSASLSGSMSLMPDDIVPTASGKNMKSGYSVKTDVTAILSTSAPSDHYTYTQTAFSVFPEFQYQTYLRLLQQTSSGMSSRFQFRSNSFSTYNRNVHFTPIWFPDATRYTVYTQVWDTWTPDGMLSVNLTDYVNIQGSMYDDWYTNRE